MQFFFCQMQFSFCCRVTTDKNPICLCETMCFGMTIQFFPSVNTSLKNDVKATVFPLQCHLMRMTEMIQCGSWTMTTWRTCMACSKK